MAEDFSAHAAKVHVLFQDPQSSERLQEMVSVLMTRITMDCVEAGTRLIGHVKCIAEIEPERYIACSVTTHDGKTRCTGAFEKASDRLDVVINVLQYGLVKEVLEKIVDGRAKEGFGEAKVEVEDLDDHRSYERKPIQIR